MAGLRPLFAEAGHPLPEKIEGEHQLGQPLLTGSDGGDVVHAGSYLAGRGAFIGND